MVRIPAGQYLLGTDAPTFLADGEGPVRSVNLDAFWIDCYATSNADFSSFVLDTGYVTEAERYGWSFVFYMLLPENQRDKPAVADAPWWLAVEGAYWRQPEGSGSSIDERLDHPVVHISWNDALAYASWAGKRLPSEAEWEAAARGGLVQAIYPWGNELEPEGKHHCNVWQGLFPKHNTLADGYLTTAPVTAYWPNAYGLYNMVGNTWEWTNDFFSARHEQMPDALNPKGPTTGHSKVLKGGSYLCHASYCNRYRVAARTHNTPDSSTGHMGFRLVMDDASPLSQ